MPKFKVKDKAPRLDGRVWASWAMNRFDAQRAAAFLTGLPEGTEFPISCGTQDKATHGERFDNQAEGWNTDEAGARVDLHQLGAFVVLTWSVLAEPQLTATLEGAEEEMGEEAEMWLSPFDLSAAMEDAGLEGVKCYNPGQGTETGEAFDFGQPERARPYDKSAGLLAAAEAVVKAWEGGDLAEAVRNLDKATEAYKAAQKGA